MSNHMNELFERALKSDPAQIGHFAQGSFMDGSIKPISDDLKVIGPAYPIRLPTNDNSMFYYAVKRAPKGSVIVIDRMGEHRIACVGEMAVRAAMAIGAVGIIVDGPSTDTRAIRELGFPVFSTGRSAVCNGLKGVDGEYNIPVNCGGAVVHPGDIVYGDLDGVIVAPADQFEDMLVKAEAEDCAEEYYREQFAQGKSISDIVNIDRLVETGIGSRIGELLKMDE